MGRVGARERVSFLEEPELARDQDKVRWLEGKVWNLILETNPDTKGNEQSRSATRVGVMCRGGGARASAESGSLN